MARFDLAPMALATVTHTQAIITEAAKVRERRKIGKKDEVCACVRAKGVEGI